LVLHAVNPDQKRPVASTQKLLTALIVAESGNLEKVVTIQASDTWAEPSKLDIRPGETYRRSDLLRILLVKSMNDVARALARDNAGSVEAFAAKMNARAEQLGMKNSHFVNPNGLPASGQHSTARDMARVAQAAYRNSTIRNIVRLKELQGQHPDGRVSEFHNTNRVLSSLPACNGMKTGYTQASGFCLISSASGNGRDVISVVLGDSKPYVWTDSHRLLAWGLSSDSRSADNP
jgi:D-alanyl-D-alanine carboxypeptidase (penicillin-binding protein 5/6)